MRKFLLALLLATTLAGLAPAVPAQKGQARCEQGPNRPRNWEIHGGAYVYFDYVLCPGDMDPPNPLARVWITTQGNGIAVEKWARDGEGADAVTVFRGKKKAYTLYRDLDAVPLTLLKAESRAGVPAGLRDQPFMAEGAYLVPFENLTPESAERARRAFENADTLIQKAQRKLALLFEFTKITAIVDALDKPLVAQK